MKTGIELIATERQEQIKKQGLDSKHDKQHENPLLSWNAAALAAPIVTYTKQNNLANAMVFNKVKVSEDWQLPSLNYAPNGSNVIVDNENLSTDKRVKQLIVAGALIAAEIDRLQSLKG